MCGCACNGSIFGLFGGVGKGMLGSGWGWVYSVRGSIHFSASRSKVLGKKGNLFVSV